jgi:hypothetical protein
LKLHARFSRKIPNVVDLNLVRCNRFLNPCFAHDFSKVKRLKIKIIQDEMTNFNFPALENLEIEFFKISDISTLRCFEIGLKFLKIHLVRIDGDFEVEMNRLHSEIRNVLPCIERYEFVDKSHNIHKR